MATLSSLLAIGFLTASASAAAPYNQYILAPSSRRLHPVSVHQINGSVVNAASVLGGSTGSAVFNNAAAVTYDFGKNVAGLVTLQIGNVSAGQFIGLTYTESSLWISGEGCDATQDAGIDEALWFQPSGPGNYSVSREHERGGFRYLSLLHNTTGFVNVQGVTVQFTPMPHWRDDQLQAYTGYFHSNDELLNRIWYAGAYTNQICTIDPTRGNSLVHLGVLNSTQLGNVTGPDSWYLNYTIASGSSVLVDGAKRDRLVWPGDMSIAVPSITVSTYDLVTIANSLDSLFALQNKTTGLLPYAGAPFPLQYSPTYHLYNLIGVADYYLYSNDLAYLQGKWSDWKLGLNFSLSFIDSSGLFNATSSADWLRFGMGGHNVEANSILYYTINQGIALGQVLNESSSLLNSWAQRAAGIKASANRLLWNDTAGMYRDNETTTLMPQDGNCWAILANLTANSSQITRISSALAARWGPYGAPAVEAANAVSPFISGFELQAHMLAGNATAALKLMRLEWGFMLDDPRMTNSTFIEGYSSDGSLHYAPYTNDPRVSHAHGWATGPTSTLTFYVGGIHLLSAGGSTWQISPMLGNLTSVDTGFQTTLGSFTSQVNASSGAITGLRFATPSGTTGSVSLPGVSGSLRATNGATVALANGMASNLTGGTWTLQVNGSKTVSNGTSTSSSTTTATPATYTGSAGSVFVSWLTLAAGWVVTFI
ncbi:glycoside hydrolase family 78 protein [Baudoinia panamericana UAMH 10762]|uniref:Glycoside hydrolase family 78 protein n=1 Tax=Baudoinia panamericana (strain UAMH 10762) TaxID=717646 RepID=M2LG86_BAUPA|nr:glycoside hydrolase family 78 protein [Baudoinia panamericana UAMH 10762]EMC93052.1 glycoside hydrolase family 78 protein [Baudoinia panamericana UAMH 10762]